MSDYYDKWSNLTKEQKHRLYELENENSFDNTDEIACPYCNGTRLSISWEDVPYEQDKEVEYECSYYDCGRKFTIIAQVIYSWNTKVPDEEAMKLLEEEIELETKDA